MKYILPVLVIILLLIFPQRVYCAEQHIEVNFIKFDEYGNHWFEQKKIPATPEAHTSIHANTALNYLFTLDKHNIFPYPQGVHVLSIHFTECHLVVSLYFPKGSYGGAMLERIYLGQILKTLLNLDGIERVSIIADTPEGLIVREESSWRPLLYGIIVD